MLDGEVLYLRPREAMLPPALFDDVADVVAMRIKDGPGIWATRHTRLAGVALGMVFLVTGVLCMTLAGPPWTVPTVLSGVFALLLIAAGAAVSRAVGDSGAGALIGYAALPYGFLAGLLVPLGAGELSGIGARTCCRRSPPPRSSAPSASSRSWTACPGSSASSWPR